MGSTVSELNELCRWLKGEAVKTVVMESTAQYWRPVWIALSAEFELYWAQTQSKRARQGRKTDLVDAERLIRQLEANELVLRFVPDAEQQEGRMLTRKRVEGANQMTRVRNQIETLLEQSRWKISGYLTDLLGISGRRMLAALAAGESDPERLASLADFRLLLKQALEQIELLDRHREEISQTLADRLKQHRDAIERLCEIPGIGVNAAEQIVAELGPAAVTFPSPEQVASWIGVCPGRHLAPRQSPLTARPKASGVGRRPH